MPRIRLIVGSMTWPLMGGREMRHYAILRGLACVGHVDLISRVHPAHADAIPSEWMNYCDQIALLPDPGLVVSKGWAHRKEQVAGLMREFRGVPRKAWRIPESNIPGDVRRILEGKYEITWVSQLSSFWRLGLEPSQSLVLDLDDLRHREYLRAASHVKFRLRSRLRRYVEGRAWKKAEMRTLRDMGRLVVCSDADRQYMGTGKVRTVHNGVDVPADLQWSPGISGRIVIIGSMGYYPNDEGARFFIKEVFPTVREAVPEAHVWVVGCDPTRQLKALDDGHSVRVLGRVNSVDPYLEDACICCVPIRMGSGTRLKIPYAMGRKVPVLATSVAAEGLDLRHGVDLLIADEPGDLARECLMLLRRADYRRRLAENGCDSVKRLYSWDTVSQQVVDVVGELFPHE